MHRFEIIRSSPLRSTDQGETSTVADEVKIIFSSISCNPQGKGGYGKNGEMPFPKSVFWLHTWYAWALFRDGVREVLREGRGL